MKAFRLLAIAACTASVAFATSSNLLVNGSFETGNPGTTVTGPFEIFSGFFLPASVSSAITGWSASAAVINSTVTFTVFTGSGSNEPAAAEGTKLLNIGGFGTAKGSGLLWQDFATSAGQAYDVSFFFGRSNNSSDAEFVGANASVFDVVGGTTSGGALGSVSTGNAPATGTIGTLSPVSFQFTASGTTSRILFADATVSTGPSLHLDAISVTASAIPEPSSFAALAGLASLGWVASRRRRA